MIIIEIYIGIIHVLYNNIQYNLFILESCDPRATFGPSSPFIWHGNKFKFKTI